MELHIIGDNISTGTSLREYVEKHFETSISKYLEEVISGTVIFSKQGMSFTCNIILNEGNKSGIIMKSDASNVDVYKSFHLALNKITKQLRRYHRKLKNHHYDASKSLNAKYCVINSGLNEDIDLDYHIENSKEVVVSDDHPVEGNADAIIAESRFEIESMNISYAAMKMDLNNLPIIVFRNDKTARINILYKRNDGNIGWIDPIEE